MKHFVNTLLVIGLCLAGAVLADEGYLDARRLAGEGKILSLEQILERIGPLHRGQILEVEFDRESHRMIYEIELLDDRGRVWELQVDAVSGEIIEHELED